MVCFASFLVFGTLGILCAAAAQGETYEDSPRNHYEEEVIDYDEGIYESNERSRRDAPKMEKSNDLIRSEKTTAGDNIIWRDNQETKKQGHVPTVTRVLYHGIYPSLNITEPLDGSYVGKYRQKRAVAEGSWDNTDGAALTTSSGTVANELEERRRTLERGTGESRSTNRRVLGETQQYLPTRDTRTPYPTPTYGNPRTPTAGHHYQHADHRRDPTKNAYIGVDRSIPSYAQGSIKYRTMYLPPDPEYRGDKENKGHVKLISVGYYNINESTADLRSYSNHRVDRNRPSGRRDKRDTHWCWLDNFLKSVWILKNPETLEEENKIPGSEPLKLEVSKANGEAHELYGYSSNGHSHHHVDRIYVVDKQPQSPEEIEKPSPETTTQQPTERTSSEQEERPEDQPILIQAPERRIFCRPPKRYARGRCRTVW